MGDPVARAFRPALQLTLGNAALADLILAHLDDYHLCAVEEMDATHWRAFFESREARDGAARALRAAFGPDGLAATPVDVDAGDWVRRSQESLRAVTVGSLIVAPPWDLPDQALWPPDASGGEPGGSHVPIVIVIEPSMGFGTGHHPSTRLALLALQRLDLSGRSVLDLGTGSGVLAIAASRLGAGRVAGVDRDPDAIESARRSVARNGLQGAIELRVAGVPGLDAGGGGGAAFDVVLANVTGEFHARHGPNLLQFVRPGGWFVAAGFTTGDEERVRAGLAGATIADRLVEDDWVALLTALPIPP